jgi:hypothetical protein
MSISADAARFKIRNPNFGTGKSSLGVARVMPVDAFWQEPLTPALAPAGERCTSSLSPHARAKAVLALAGSL